MKVYGKDLLRQYEGLIARIKKRNQFLIKTAGDDVLDKTNLNLQFDDADPIKLLNQIIAIEQAYVKKSKQLDLFREP